MLKTGLVLSIQKNRAHMVTPSGEFVKVKIKDRIPKVGENYSGDLAKDFSLPKISKLPVVAASIVFMLLFSGTAFAYYTPTSSVIVDINPSIMLKLNRFNKIIKSVPLNNDGEKVLQEVKINNKSINDGLKVIVDEAKKDNFINDNYIKANKTVTLFVDSKNKKDLDLVSFQKFMVEAGVNLRINSNGTELKVEPKNASTEDSKNNNSSSKQNDKDKQKSDNKQTNENKQSTDKKQDNGTPANNNSNEKKETPNNSNSSNKNSTSVSNGKSTENNTGGKSEDKKTTSDEKKKDSTTKSNGNNDKTKSNSTLNNENGKGNNDKK